MLAEKLKALREAKAWSQAHLAEAARVNIRTVQRIEAGEPASHETLLSLAAALGVDLKELGADARGHAGWSDLSALRFALALLLVVPAALFITVNLLRTAGGLAAPYDALAAAGARLMSFHTFNIVSPAIFLGAPAAAFLICLPALVRLRWNRIGAHVSIKGLEVGLSRRALGVGAAALLCSAILLAYAVAETLRTPAG